METSELINTFLSPFFQWESVGELNKLQNIEDLVISYDENITLYFQEFAFARISNLKVRRKTSF